MPDSRSGTELSGPTRSRGGIIETARTFRAHPASLHGIREFVREEALDAGLDSILDDLVLAASEAAANAVMHTDTDDIEVRLRADGPDVEIQVRDRGIFKRRVPMPFAEGGRGIFVMMALMDEVGIREGNLRQPGTVVTLRKRSVGQLARA